MKKLFLFLVAALGISGAVSAQTITVVNHTGCSLDVRFYGDDVSSSACGASCPGTGGVTIEYTLPTSSLPTVFQATTLTWLSCAGTGWQSTWLLEGCTAHDNCPSGAATVSGTDGGQSSGCFGGGFSGSVSAACGGGCTISNMIWTDNGPGNVQVDIY